MADAGAGGELAEGGAADGGATAAEGGESGSPESGNEPEGGAAGSAVPASAGEAGQTLDSDACAGKLCDTPPANDCQSPSVFRAYDMKGSCANGQCTYHSQDVPCSCANHACTTDPCLGVNCSSNQRCATGLCSVCKADSSCGSDCTSCGAASPKCKDLGTTSKCVQCLSNADCGGLAPICDPKTNVCGPQPSCIGLPATCGPNGNASCCASNLVPGISTPSFYRGYDGVTAGYTDKSYPAQVSDFRLDTYEITVGRFRRFVAAYSQGMIAQGAGANPNNPSDPGWDSKWNDSLPASSGLLTKALTNALDCPDSGLDQYGTWTDSTDLPDHDKWPISCLNWFEAEAFCTWDGGRLPTEAEWNYAAAGGTSQRKYPWGSATPSCSYANYYGGSYGKDFCVAPPSGFVDMVGTDSPLGDGAFGQADLSGNVAEWVQDWYAATYPTPCNNCSNPIASSSRVFRSSSFDSFWTVLVSSYRNGSPPSSRSPTLGARCARNP